MQNSNDGSLLRQTVEHRDGARYAFVSPVDIVNNQGSVSVGELIDISRSGAAFRTEAPIDVSQPYSLVVYGIGAMNCTIIRKFNRNCYGVIFAISSAEQSRLEERVIKLIEASGAAG